MATCPSNHESQTTDFCSVCGIEMTGSTQTAPAAAGSVIAAEPCPICQTPRAPDGGDYCEECGYNFRTGTAAPITLAPEPAVAAPEPAPATPIESPTILAETAVPEPQPAIAEPPASTTAASPFEPPKSKPTWEAVVSVDAAIRGTPAADAPTGHPDRLYPLDGDKTIGRRSISKSFTPDIDLTNDTAVSHQQAKLAVQSNGEVALIDLDSVNGTLLNKVKIPANVLHLLKDGDVIAVGGFTKILIRKTNK